MIKGTFNFKYECKHSVRFDAATEKDKEVVSAIYISKKAHKELSEPENITVELGKG